jgi:hypothetical protein
MSVPQIARSIRQATQRILQREFRTFGRQKFQGLALLRSQSQRKSLPNPNGTSRPG